jgi:hypothetical protein
VRLWPSGLKCLITRVRVVQFGGHGLKVVRRHGENDCSPQLLLPLCGGLSECAVQCRVYSVGCAAGVAEGRRICSGNGAVVCRNRGRWLQWGILKCEKEGMG